MLWRKGRRSDNVIDAGAKEAQAAVAACASVARASAWVGWPSWWWSAC